MVITSQNEFCVREIKRSKGLETLNDLYYSYMTVVLVFTLVVLIFVLVSTYLSSNWNCQLLRYLIPQIVRLTERGADTC